MTEATTVQIVSLGCARNDVDSDELAARLEAGGFRIVAEGESAEAVLVNTCGFIDAAKKDSIDTLLAASDARDEGVKAVVAVGCMAERYGRDLGDSLPEVDAVLGFDAYPDIASRLRGIMAGERPTSHVPHDRRQLLPLAPLSRPAAAASVIVPGMGEALQAPGPAGPASGPRVLRRRLAGGPSAPLKIASGCDRRCAFCAIPSFRGAFVSRPAADIVTEARWLVEQGVREVLLVSENTSSYGKDLGEARALERLIADLSGVDGLEWIRVSYLQPAEIRPSLIEAMCATDKVVPYFDLSFQHASGPLLRRMRRFGDDQSFLALLDGIRTLAPNAGIRSNVIVGFPGETDKDFETLVRFAEAARLDALGVFGYSDEEGTEGATLDGHISQAVIDERYEELSSLVDQLLDQRADERVGERVRVLIEGPDGLGRAEHQAPETDGSTQITGAAAVPGEFVWGRVTGHEGVDLMAVAEAQS